MKRGVVHPRVEGKVDISLIKLLFYNILFFAPLLIAFIVSDWLSLKFYALFGASPFMLNRIFMFIFSFGVFFFFIPFIRKREKVGGIRFSVLAFLLVGMGMTLPEIINGNVGPLLSLSLYFANYLLLTFILAPEVLGIHSNISDWFDKEKHLIILFIYLAIVFLYVFGFGQFYYDLYRDDACTSIPFNLDENRDNEWGTFIYYSIVTFATTGFGDITPLSPAARVMTAFEIMSGMIINVLFIAMLLVYISGAQNYILKREEHTLERETEELKEEAEEVVEGAEKKRGVSSNIVKNVKKKTSKKVKNKPKSFESFLKQIREI